VTGVRLVVADALEVDWVATLGEQDRRWRLVANLPYNVAVPIVVSLLADAPMVDELLVMVQKEVAERLVAGPGGRTVGLPSLRVAWYASAELVELVPPEVFIPQPRVTSALVRMTRRAAPATDLSPAAVFPLIERAYRQRRKMLRVTLGDVADPRAFEVAGIEPTARPEELSIGRWVDLARAVASPS
jgi:16S rRNA (adenine1518-N6/adenine1519-N6)-dimethyltransferase